MESGRSVLFATLLFALFAGLAAAQIFVTTSITGCGIMQVGDSLRAGSGAYATLKSVSDYAAPRTEQQATFSVYGPNGEYLGDYTLKLAESKTVSDTITITFRNLFPGVNQVVYADVCGGAYVPKTSTNCNDSDKTPDYYGLNSAETMALAANDTSLYVRGTISAYDTSGNNYFNKIDSCNGNPSEMGAGEVAAGGWIREYLCDRGEYYGYNIFQCPNGCRDGACLSAAATPTPEPTPTPAPSGCNSSMAPGGTLTADNGAVVTLKLISGVGYTAAYVPYAYFVVNDAATGQSETKAIRSGYSGTAAGATIELKKIYSNDNQNYYADVCIKAAGAAATVGRCEDSDGGRNLFEKGTLQVTYASGSYAGKSFTQSDFCSTNNGWIQEYYCNEAGEAVTDNVACPAGYYCKNGACLKEAATPTTGEAKPQAAPYTIRFAAGWNLFSVPYSAAQVTASDCLGATAWHYDAAANQYSKQAALVVGAQLVGQLGFWFKAASACTITLSGASPASLDGLKLRAGWNQVGAPSSETALDAVIGDCVLVSRPWAYDASGKKYAGSATLKPGKGYWIEVASDCTLGASAAGGMPPAPAG